MVVPFNFRDQFKAYITSRQFASALKARNLRLHLFPSRPIRGNIVPIYRKGWRQINSKPVIEIELKPLADNGGPRAHLNGKITVRQKHLDSIWEVIASR